MEADTPIPLLELGRPDAERALDRLVDRLRSGFDEEQEVARRVRGVIADVRREGDAALVRYMRRWTDSGFDASAIRVDPAELERARDALPAELRSALERAIDHVRAYQSHIRPVDPAPIALDGAQLGLRFTPLQRVGLHVPGGRAAYPSTLVMLAVPAQVAGVETLSVVTPPPTGGGEVSPLVLGVCGLLGVKRVHRLGGAQAIAALAYGTESVEPVDFIAGPGNVYSQQAKRQVFGSVGIDGLFGSSEVVVLADESARPDWVAADLIAQAEHDPGCCFLISTSRPVLDRVLAEVQRQLPDRRRADVIRTALGDGSAAIHAPDRAAALATIDRLAAEHVTLAVADPEAALAELRHGGAWFLGDRTPVASGDYYAGPSHCLPTGTTARFSSGLSVYTFLKRSSVERYPEGMDDRAIRDVARLAEAEGLEAHAESVRRRGA